MKNAAVLQRLIRACVDDEHTLRHERKFVGAGVADSLARLASERGQFAEDLERLDQGAHHRTSGSWAEMVREAGRTLWVSAAGPNRGDAMRSCRHSRARTEARYDDAMQRAWPDEVRVLLTAQRRRIQDETDELNRLQF